MQKGKSRNATFINLAFYSYHLPLFDIYDYYLFSLFPCVAFRSSFSSYSCWCAWISLEWWGICLLFSSRWSEDKSRLDKFNHPFIDYLSSVLRTKMLINVSFSLFFNKYFCFYCSRYCLLRSDYHSGSWELLSHTVKPGAFLSPFWIR